MKRVICPGLLALVSLLGLGCEVTGVNPVSTYPMVVCEAGGQRQVRVYGHGLSADLEVALGGVKAEIIAAAADGHTLDVMLPDISAPEDAFWWYPYNHDGEPGLYVWDRAESRLVPHLWDVEVAQSRLLIDGTPDFRRRDDERLIYRSFEVDSVILGYSEDGEPDVLPGPFSLGYFSEADPNYAEDGSLPAGCEDGVDDYAGQLCYVPRYYSFTGAPLYYDAGWLAYSLFYTPWDPYLYIGAYYADDETGSYAFLYDDSAGETPLYDPADYPLTTVYNRSFGVFFSMRPQYVYEDAEGGLVQLEQPSQDESLTFIGLDLSSMTQEYFPDVMPITDQIQLTFRAGEQVYSLQSPIGVVSREFDYSVLYSSSPYYDFDPDAWKVFETEDPEEGTPTPTEVLGLRAHHARANPQDVELPADGSWGCRWQGY